MITVSRLRLSGHPFQRGLQENAQMDRSPWQPAELGSVPCYGDRDSKDHKRCPSSLGNVDSTYFQIVLTDFAIEYDPT